jgi:hypothetical protein
MLSRAIILWRNAGFYAAAAALETQAFIMVRGLA